jgi:fatty acid synthase subunit beta
VWEDMVIAGDALRIELQHSAMERGAMVIDVNVYNDQTGNRVMIAEAIVNQAATAYVFCGQGSQKQNMGMKLYEDSLVARAIWDRGDRALHDRFGISILDIVRKNPRQVQVKFGGKRGRQVRENYLTMAGGDTDDVCVVPGITSKSMSHTFSEQRGLLFSTQFSQSAL